MTLLEVLFAIAIIGGSFVAALQLSTQALHITKRAAGMTRATVLAQNELEFWKNAGGAKLLALGAGEHAFQNPTASEINGDQWKATLSVTPREDGLVQAEATIAYPGEPHHPGQMSLKTWLRTAAK